VIELEVTKGTISQGVENVFQIGFIVSGSQSSKVSDFMKYSDKNALIFSSPEMGIKKMTVQKKKIAQGTDNEIKLTLLAEKEELDNVYSIMQCPDDKTYTIQIKPGATLFDEMEQPLECEEVQ